MSRRTLIVVVRQAGSAAGVIPTAENLARDEQTWQLAVIAFPQAVATCQEVSQRFGSYPIHGVTTEEEGRRLFSGYLENAGLLLTGTSAEAEADAFYWRSAREHGVVSIAYLDQWSNIDKRFPGPLASDWPDQLAVIDSHDEQLARAIAPESVIIQVTGSPALERIKSEVVRLRAAGHRADGSRFVFATEPVDDPQAYRLENGFCDEDSFAVALELIRRHHPGVTLVMRPHPRDHRERWLPKMPADMAVEWDIQSRAECLASAGVVFGMRSFFLLEALTAGVPVVSLQPNKATPCPLTDGRMPVIIDADDYDPRMATL